MREYDVLIVGGGPAGSTLAWKLKDTGLKVGIIDKSTYPRDKVCAGWITPAVADELQLDTEAYAKQHTLQPLTGFRVGMIGDKASAFDYDRIVSYGIRRCEFDDYLLHRCDADLHTGTAVKKLARTEQGWQINEDFHARLLVGAGGHFCPIARELGAKPGQQEPAVVAKEIEFLMTDEQVQQCAVDEKVPELYFCQDLKGYGWIFRKGNYLNIGLGRQDTNKLTQHVKAFVDGLVDEGRLPPGISDKFNGHAYLLYNDCGRQIIDDQVMLIGDAAGLAYTQSGEGIRPAVESALMAATVILQAQSDFSAANLQSYQQQLIDRFGQRQVAPKSMFLPEGLRHFLASKLLATRWFSRHVVIDRWFIHANLPPLQV